ncbi:MAG: DUF2400 family protein [Bacteroidia bacterium]
MSHQTNSVIINKTTLKSFLDEQVDIYNRLDFIASDPVFIPHQFTKKEDIEISGFFAATLAWGIRKSIINNSTKLMLMMDNAPHDFILNATDTDYKPFKKFVHRTFNAIDCINFIQSLQHIYKNHGGIEKVFTDAIKMHEQKTITEPSHHHLANAINHFRNIFLNCNPLREAKNM